MAALKTRSRILKVALFNDIRSMQAYTLFIISFILGICPSRTNVGSGRKILVVQVAVSLI